MWADAHFFVNSPSCIRGHYGLAYGETSRERGVMFLQLHPVAKKVADLLDPHVERQGFELVSVEYRKGTRSSLLRLLVDRPEGGITLADLEKGCRPARSACRAAGLRAGQRRVSQGDTVFAPASPRRPARRRYYAGRSRKRLPTCSIRMSSGRASSWSASSIARGHGLRSCVSSSTGPKAVLRWPISSG